MRLQFIINGQDVTNFVQKEGFPEWLEESVKGTGYFDFRVRPFTFKILTGGGLTLHIDDDTSITLARKASIVVKDPATGEKHINGLIDSIDDELSPTPSITIFPNALILKDTIVGDEINEGDDEDEEKIYEFDTQGYKSVRYIVQQVLSYVASKTGTEFSITSESCPDPDPNSDKLGSKGKFFGSVLRTITKGGLIWQLLTWLIPGLYEGAEFRKKSNGDYYLIIKDGGIFERILFGAGTWFEILITTGLKWETVYLLFEIPTIEIEWTKIDLGWLGKYDIPSGIDIGSFRPSLDIPTGLDMKLYQFPPNDIKIPYVGTQYYVYKCKGGGLEYVASYDYAIFPKPDTTTPNLDQYGSVYRSKRAKNVSDGKIKALSKEEGIKDVKISVSFDLDEYNSYALIEGKRKNQNWMRDFIMSFETPFDFNYSCIYRNATAMEIIRDLAIVTDRWVYIDVNNKVWMLPKAKSIEPVDIQRNTILKIDKKRQKEIDSDININRYEEDGDGRIIANGIKMRKNEFEAIRKYFRDKFQGERIEHTIKILNTPQNLSLLKEARIIVGDNGIPEDYGVIIERKKNLLEPVTEIIAEVLNV